MKLALKITIPILCVLALCAGAYFGVMAMSDETRFVTTFYQVEDEKLTSDVRIAFVSDLHLNELGAENCDLIQRIAELNPDIIAVGGDMNILGEYEKNDAVYKLVSRLKDIAPVYYGLGNHELNEIVLYENDMITALTNAGAIVLHDRFEIVEINGNKLCIGGLSESEGGVDKWSGNFREEFADNECFKLLLSHYPSNFGKNLEGYDIDLVLCGHRHGGGFIIPYIYEPYTQGERIIKTRADGCVMIESRGLGRSNKIPRFNNPPELVVVDLIGR